MSQVLKNNTHTPTEIAIVGTGIAGVLSALLLADVRNESGERRFHITLIDKAKLPFNGATLVAGRDHSGGGEYPLDRQTAEDCVYGSMMLKATLPDDEQIWSDRSPTRFSISKRTQKIGEYCVRLLRDEKWHPMKDGSWIRLVRKTAPIVASVDAMMQHSPIAKVSVRIDKKMPFPEWPEMPEEEKNYDVLTCTDPDDNTTWRKVDREKHWETPEGLTLSTNSEGELQFLTLAKYLQHYRDMQLYYTELLKKVAAARRCSFEEAAMSMSGMPEDFFDFLSSGQFPRPYKDYPVEGGFLSRERGFNIPYYLTYLLHQIDVLRKEGVIDTYVETEALSRHTQYGKQVLVTNKFIKEFDQVIMASGPGNAAFGSLEPGEELAVHNRAMLLIDISGLDEKYKTPEFRLLGEDGAMFAPINSKYAFLYVPDKDCAYRSGSQILTHDSPVLETRPGGPRWDKDQGSIKSSDRFQWSEKYMAKGIQHFPFLDIKDGRGLRIVKAERLIIEPTINKQYSLEKRRHADAREVEPGVIIIDLTKATFAATGAQQACAIAVARSENKELPETLSPPDRDALFDSVMRGERKIPAVDMDSDIAFTQFDKIIGGETKLSEFSEGVPEIILNQQKFLVERGLPAGLAGWWRPIETRATIRLDNLGDSQGWVGRVAFPTKDSPGRSGGST